MSQETYFITTAIPYVNARPHIGFALELAQTDVFARTQRALGKDVRFLTGTDENSLKNVLAAEEAGMSTAGLVSRNAQYFVDLARRLEISNDDFIRTAREERHRLGCRKLWAACAERGDIYKQTYSGLYCVGCEQFYTPEELVDGRCPEHGTVPETVAEENYFFRLSRYEQQLRDYIEADRLRIVPETRKNEVLSFIRMGLRDFSISRSRQRARGWGIEVPGDPGQVMYVWFDALANYITALNYAEEGPLYHRYWLDGGARVHTIGKGIIRFHAVYWPAMLLSAGVPLPTTLFVHGYMTSDGQKMSKSLGNVVDPIGLIDEFGAEALRYFLLSQVPATGDADFTRARFVDHYNAELANDLGNLLQRSVSMVHRYRAGVVPVPPDPAAAEAQRWQAAADRTTAAFLQALEAMDPQAALREVWRLVDDANKYVETSAPWTLAKRARQEGDASAAGALDDVLYNLIELARLIGAYLHPLLPETAQRIAAQVNVPPPADAGWREQLRWGVLPAGTALPAPTPLFPKKEG